jgi:hypothetical protein
MFERMKVEKEEGRGQDMANIVDPPTVTVATTATYAAAAAARTPATGKAATPAIGQATATTGDAEKAKSRMLRLNKRLKTLNSYSSLCNVLSLMSLSWHLARRLLGLSESRLCCSSCLSYFCCLIGASCESNMFSSLDCR